MQYTLWTPGGDDRPDLKPLGRSGVKSVEGTIDRLMLIFIYMQVFIYLQAHNLEQYEYNSTTWCQIQCNEMRKIIQIPCHYI